MVTPSFGQLDWLRLAIASVADQGIASLEHIVQDGGTDNISEILTTEFADLMAKDQALKLYVEKDSGMYDAINRGLAKASGDICGYLNCDEQYLPGALSKVVSYFEHHPNIDLLFGDSILVDKDGIPLAYRRAILPSLTHLRLADLNILTCAMFFRRRLIEAGNLFPTHLKIAGDQYWIFQLLKAEKNMAVLPEPLGVFTFTGANLSRSADAATEKFGWLPNEERPIRWMTPFVVAWHRLRKLFAGAYRRRDVEIKIYTLRNPKQRMQITQPAIGGRWPRIS
ncbi:MAG: glycosyltransferase [Chthoniobacterales bacterium]